MAKTLRKYGAKYNTTYCELCGLSTDVKPVTSFGGINIANGSKFVEMDSNKEFRYDAGAKVWHEVTDGGSGGSGSATLIEKTITANGTFVAAGDDADGYSKVVINVPLDIKKITSKLGIDKDDNTNYGYLTIYEPLSSGVVSVPWRSDKRSEIVIIKSPVSRIVIAAQISGVITFTPKADYEGIFQQGGGVDNIRINGDDVVPNDGKMYVATFYSNNVYSIGNVVYVYIKRYDDDFAFTIE